MVVVVTAKILPMISMVLFLVATRFSEMVKVETKTHPASGTASRLPQKLSLH